MDNQQSLSLSGVGLDWVTTAHLVFLVLFAIGAVAILIWGRHLRRKRRGAEREVEKRTPENDDSPN